MSLHEHTQAAPGPDVQSVLDGLPSSMQLVLKERPDFVAQAHKSEKFLNGLVLMASKFPKEEGLDPAGSLNALSGSMFKVSDKLGSNTSITQTLAQGKPFVQRAPTPAAETEALGLEAQVAQPDENKTPDFSESAAPSVSSTAHVRCN